MTLSRNRHSRLNDHFGLDLDTNLVLNGAVGDIPSGTTVHDALLYIQSGGEGATPINWADPALGTLIYYYSAGWTAATLINDDDPDTYHTADGDACMRVALDDQRLTYQATVRMAFSSTASVTYEFYGTNASDYSGLVLLDSVTFDPVGSNTAENVVFDWIASNPYQYYVLSGPSETRRIHELTLYARIGAITASHPLLLDRDLPAQHPAAAVSFDDTVADLGADDAQTAIETLATIIAGGLSVVLANVTAGYKVDLEMPFAGSITAVRLLADQAGSIVLDLWKDNYTNFPPTVADTICGGSKPTLSGADKAENTSLTGWTTAFAAGDIIRVNVDSSSTVTRVTLALRLRRTT